MHRAATGGVRNKACRQDQPILQKLETVTAGLDRERRYKHMRIRTRYAVALPADRTLIGNDPPFSRYPIFAGYTGSSP